MDIYNLFQALFVIFTTIMFNIGILHMKTYIPRQPSGSVSRVAIGSGESTVHKGVGATGNSLKLCNTNAHTHSLSLLPRQSEESFVNVSVVTTGIGERMVHEAVGASTRIIQDNIKLLHTHIHSYQDDRLGWTLAVEVT